MTRKNRPKRAAQGSLVALACAAAAMIAIGVAGELSRPTTTLPDLPAIPEPIRMDRGDEPDVNRIVTITTSWADREAMGRIIHQDTTRNGSDHRRGRLDAGEPGIYTVPNAELARLQELAGYKGDGDGPKTTREDATVLIRLHSPLAARESVRNALWAAGTVLALAMTAAIVSLSWLVESERT